MIWRWSLNLSVSSLNGYDSLYSLYIFVLFETIQFVGYPFLLLLAFFLISFFLFLQWMWNLKVGGADSHDSSSVSQNPEHPDPFKLFFLWICFHWLAFLCWFAFLLLLLFCCCWFDIGYVIKPKPTQEIIVWRDLRGPATRTWLSNVFPCNS